MSKMLSLEGFLQRNIILNLLWFMTTISVYSFAPLMNITLIEYFAVTEQELSFISSALIMGFIVAAFLNSYFMNNHVNIVKILLISLSVFLISLSIEFYLLTFETINLKVLTIFRTIDGLSSFLVIVTINHVISTKILRNKLRVKIISLMSSSSYIIKTISPIIMSMLITVTKEPSIIFLIAIILTIVSIYVIYVYKKYIYIKYTRILLKTVGSKKRKSLEEIKNYFKKEDSSSYYYRIYYLITEFCHNILRSNYDLIMPAALLLKYNLSLTQSTFLISLMVVGQSIQFLLSLVLKYLKIEFFYIIHLFAHLLIFILFFEYEINNMLLLGVLFLALGVSRAIFQIWKYEFGMKLISKKITLQNHNFISGTLSEFAHLLSYGLVGLLIFIPGQYENFKIFSISVIIFLMIMEIFKFLIERKNKLISIRD